MNQLTILQKMGAVKRMEQSFLLSDFTRELALQNIKDKLGKRASKRQILRKLYQRLHPE